MQTCTCNHWLVGFGASVLGCVCFFLMYFNGVISLSLSLAIVGAPHRFGHVDAVRGAERHCQATFHLELPRHPAPRASRHRGCNRGHARFVPPNPRVDHVHAARLFFKKQKKTRPEQTPNERELKKNHRSHLYTLDGTQTILNHARMSPRKRASISCSYIEPN